MLSVDNPAETVASYKPFPTEVHEEMVAKPDITGLFPLPYAPNTIGEPAPPDFDILILP